jgi:hypothetical protein
MVQDYRRSLRTLILLLSFISTQSSAAIRSVPITFLEALSPRDSTSSEVFQKHFEDTVSIALKLVEPKLKACGYELKPKVVFYSASDILQAFENGQKESQSGTWFIIGPRRTNHVLLIGKGAPNIPIVSLMASGDALEKQSSWIHSVYPSNRQLAKGLVAGVEALRREPNASLLPISKLKNRTYYTVLSQDCLTCVEFSKDFDLYAKTSGWKKLGESPVLGEDADVTAQAQQVAASKANFVLVPNYSRVSASIMGAVQKIYPSAFFLGGDGWGDQKFGFVARNSHVADASGISVRGFPTVARGLAAFTLGQELLAASPDGSTSIKSGPALSILRVIEGLEKVLCDSKPTNASEFGSTFPKYIDGFASPWGINLYQLEKSEIQFKKRIGSR